MKVIYTFIFVSILFSILFLIDLFISNSETQKDNFVVNNITIYIIINPNNKKAKTDYDDLRTNLEKEYGVVNVFMIYYNSNDYKLLNILDKPIDGQGIVYIKKGDKTAICKEQYIDLVYERITLTQIKDKIKSM